MVEGRASTFRKIRLFQVPISARFSSTEFLRVAWQMQIGVAIAAYQLGSRLLCGVYVSQLNRIYRLATLRPGRFPRLLSVHCGDALGW